MSPDLLAVAALLRCMKRRDYAGAAALVTRRETLQGLDRIATPILTAEAEQQRALERDIRSAVALIAQALAEGPCSGTNYCMHCGAIDGCRVPVLPIRREAAASSGWPVSRTEAA